LRRFAGALVLVVPLLVSPARAGDTLEERFPEYKAAVHVFETQGANVQDWEKIVAGAKDRALLGHALFFLGRACLDVDDYERACDCFGRVQGDLASETPWADEATLYLGYAYARRPSVDEAQEKLFRARARTYIEMLVGPSALYASCPERTREVARWLLKELSGEGSGPLLELSSRMEAIEHAIDRELTGPPVQKRQEAVISELDRLIALMRERETDAKKAGQGPKKATGPAPQSRPETPLAPGAEGPKAQDRDWLPGLDLTAPERARALQFLKEHFPTRYKELVEQYWKSLAERGTRPR